MKVGKYQVAITSICDSPVNIPLLNVIDHPTAKRILDKMCGGREWTEGIAPSGHRTYTFNYADAKIVMSWQFAYVEVEEEEAA